MSPGIITRLAYWQPAIWDKKGNLFLLRACLLWAMPYLPTSYRDLTSHNLKKNRFRRVYKMVYMVGNVLMTWNETSFKEDLKIDEWDWDWDQLFDWSFGTISLKVVWTWIVSKCIRTYFIALQKVVHNCTGPINEAKIHFSLPGGKHAPLVRRKY